MSSETHDPALATPGSDSTDSGLLGSGGSPSTEGGKEPSISIPPYSSSSGDELNALLTKSLTQPAPDPFLGAFSDEAKEPPVIESESIPDPVEPSSPGLLVPAAAFEASSPEPVSLELPRDPGESSRPEVPGGKEPSGSFDTLAALAALAGLNPTESAPADPAPEFPIPLATEPAEPRVAKADDSEEDEDDDHSHRGMSWPTLLLFSYASAVTIGLLWVLLSGRKIREREEVDLFPAGENRLDPGRRADQSRKIVPPPPIAKDHLATFGQTIRMGSLEVTPLEIASGPVELEQAFSPSKHRKGGSGTLRLKLKLKNLSSDTIFVPLDEAFIRERDRGEPDSYIETANGGMIPMYPLAVESEWSIRGQTFEELQPGESSVALLVSETDVSDLLTPEMTWRVRLRTGIEQTDTIGIRFSEDEIRSEP